MTLKYHPPLRSMTQWLLLFVAQAHIVSVLHKVCAHDDDSDDADIDDNGDEDNDYIDDDADSGDDDTEQSLWR